MTLIPKEILMLIGGSCVEPSIFDDDSNIFAQHRGCEIRRVVSFYVTRGREILSRASNDVPPTFTTNLQMAEPYFYPFIAIRECDAALDATSKTGAIQ